MDERRGDTSAEPPGNPRPPEPGHEAKPMRDGSPAVAAGEGAPAPGELPASGAEPDDEQAQWIDDARRRWAAALEFLRRH